MGYSILVSLLAVLFLPISARKLHTTLSQGTHMQWSLRALIPDVPYWEEQTECRSTVVQPKNPLPLNLVPVTFAFFSMDLPRVCGTLSTADFGECANDMGEISGCCSLECSQFLNQIDPACWKEIKNSVCSLPSQQATNVLDLLVRRCDESKGDVTCLMNCRENDSCAQADKALLHASAVGDAAAVKELLLRGANPNVMDEDHHKRGPLYIAARDGHLGVVQVLLAQDADIEGHETRGATPLMAAAYYGHIAVTSVLIAEGAPLDTQDSRGRTALYFAAQNGHEEALKTLMKAGAKLNVRAHDDSTALSQAKSRQKFLVVQILLSSGARD